MSHAKARNNSKALPMQLAAKVGSNVSRMEKLGVSRFDLADPYHLALTLGWGQFLLALIGLYLAINGLFALLYFIKPGSVSNLPAYSLVDAFFFSIETLATVGYGNMAPISLYGHVVSAVETFVGTLLTAVMTGLVFVRFSKPKAKILFADKPVLLWRKGRASLMIRIGNGRLHPLHEASVRITSLQTGDSPDGQRFRRSVDLKLARDDMPFFPLTWTLIHEIGPDSPLQDLLAADSPSLQDSSSRLLVSVVARDPSLGAQVYSTQAYSGVDIAVGMRYVDAISSAPDGSSVADMRLLSSVEPDVEAPGH